MSSARYARGAGEGNMIHNSVLDALSWRHLFRQPMGTMSMQFNIEVGGSLQRCEWRVYGT